MIHIVALGQRFARERPRSVLMTAVFRFVKTTAMLANPVKRENEAAPLLLRCDKYERFASASVNKPAGGQFHAQKVA